MSVRLVRGARVAGHDTWIVENEAMRVTIAPGLGGRLLELYDKASGRDLFWHNPRTPPRAAPYGAHFDDWWSGGWDEIFPSGDRGTFNGEPLPYMGELWCVPWTANELVTSDTVQLVTSTFATIAPARFERRLTVRGDEPVLRFDYRIENLDVRPLPFTWGIHPVFAVEAGHRIDHPGLNMLVGVSSGPSFGSQGVGYTWPFLPDPTGSGGHRDMRQVRGRDADAFGGHWVMDLPAGWLALTDPSIRRGIAIIFPIEVFPHAWLWQVYGGWRGHHHVALEPWTSYPQQLDAAIAAGRARAIETGGEVDASVQVVLFGGLEAVTDVQLIQDEVHVT